MHETWWFRNRRLAATLHYFAAFLLGASTQAVGDDWPQWLGPQRDGIWRETGILDRFPIGGPKLLWYLSSIGNVMQRIRPVGSCSTTDRHRRIRISCANASQDENASYV